MAEGILGGVLGEEEERPEVEGADASIGAEAFAASIAAIASRQDPGVARRTEEFLIEQTKLLKLQSEHVEDEHALRMAHLRNQVKEENVRRLGLRLRVTLQLVLTMIAMCIGVGLIFMARDAIGSRQVVIDPFEAPPALAASGLGGKVVAAGLLDELTRIQAANRSGAEKRAISNAWTNEITVEVPETGISFGQIERILKTRFGHDQHIDGDLVITQTGGLALTVRGTGVLPRTFVNEKRDLDRLITQAAEYVYSQSQPGLWVGYLNTNNRSDEAIRFAREVYGSARPEDRPLILSSWANAITSKGGEEALAQALPLYRESVRLKPDYWVGYYDIMFGLAALGDEEAVVHTGKQMMEAAGGRPGRAPEEMYGNYDIEVWDLPAERNGYVDDMESHGGIGTAFASANVDNLNIAIVDVQMHDAEAASLRFNATTIDEKNSSDVSYAAFVRALLVEETGDLKRAAMEWDAFAAAYADPAVSTSNPQYICYAAVSYEKTGQHAKADAALNPYGGKTFVDCYRFKADVLELRGDWAGAQEWYAKAVKLGPSIPSGYYSWGMALFKHGELDAAAAKFKDANQKGPHWADPLKAWGDVLVKQGKPKDALAKYDEALKYAPNWKQLKEAREAASQAKG